MYYTRAERYECRFDINRAKTANDLTNDEFCTWSAKAANLRQLYIVGEIQADIFLRGIALDERDLRLDLINPAQSSVTI